MENIPEEMSVPSKVAEEGKSSSKRKKVVYDTSTDSHTTCREELDSTTEGKQDETAVTEEERSESSLTVNDQMEREGGVNLCSLEDSNYVTETESANLRTSDMTDDTSQESQISELQVSKIRSQERQFEETRETQNKDIHHSHRPDEKQSTSEGGSQSEIMKTEKSAERRPLQRPKPNLLRSSGRREAATQDKMDAETSSPNPANTDEKSSEEDRRRNRNEATEAENRDTDNESEEPEKTAIAKTLVRGYRQRFKPNVRSASGRKEEPEKDAGNDNMSHLQLKGEAEKNTDQSNRCDVTSEEAAEKDDKVLETVFQSNEASGLQCNSKQSLLNPTPLRRGRVQRPKPNLGRTVARQKELIDEKDPAEETTKGGEVEKGVIHHRDENNDSCLKSDLTIHEDTQPCAGMLEGDVSTDSDMNSRYTRQSFQEKSSETESCESEKELSDVLKEVSDFNTGESDPQKEEEKTVVAPAWLLRSRFQRPKPNLRMTTSRKEVLDKTGKYEVLKPLESLGKEMSLHSQEVSERPCCRSPKTGSKDGELELCLPYINEDDVSTTNTGKNNTEEESKQKPLPPIQLVQSNFQRYKPNVARAFGKNELQVSENERKKNPEEEHSVLQEDEFANTVIGESEAVLCQADVLSKEEHEQQEVPQVPSVSGSILCEQRSTEKSTSQEGKLGALKPGQFIRIDALRARPNLETACSKKEPPVQRLAVPDAEEMNKGEKLPVAEESEKPLSSTDDMEVFFMGDLAKNDNLDTNSKSMKSEMLCSSKKSPNCHSKGEQEDCPSTDAIESVLNTTERSNDKLSSGEKSGQRAREPHWNPVSGLMRLTRKRDYPKESENKEEDNSENRNKEECLVLLKTGVSMQNSSNTVETASFSEATRKHNFAENAEETSCKRIKQDITPQSPEILSECESQVEQDDDFQLSASQEKHSDNLTRRQFRRSSKRIAPPKHVLELRTAASFASECEADCSEKGNQRQEAKLSVTRGKSLKTKHRKKSGKDPRSSKITFVTLRASQEEEDEEADDFEHDDEDECFAPEEVNKAPVFVPIGLRSPKPIPVQIEETMEELEISVTVPDVQVATDVESLSHASIQPVVQMEEKEATVHENPDVDKGINDGSTEAAMTLLAMGDPNFQLKTSTEDTSAKELLPFEDGGNINIENQSSGTRIVIEDHLEKAATDISDSSLPVVNSMSLTGDRLLKPEPTFGVLGSENIIQKLLSTNVLEEQLEQIQSDPTTVRDIAEMQKVELEQIIPAVDDSSVLCGFASGSMELSKQVDKTERAENQTRGACENSEDLRPVIVSPKSEKSHLGLEDCSNQSSVDELPEQNPFPLEPDTRTVSFTQNKACALDTQQPCVSSTEETAVVNDGHRCPEEEQTIILTLVEIPVDSEEFDASVLLEQTSEPLLPAPILISPINASETNVTEVESIGSVTTAACEVAAPLNSMETKQPESALVNPVPKLKTTQKRSAAELEENDFPIVKKTLSTVAVEDSLETTSKGYSMKSTDAPMLASGKPFKKIESSAKEEGPISVLMSESMSQLAETNQLETLENLGKASVENSASKQEEEVVSRLTSNRKAEISGQGKQENVHEPGQLESTGCPASSSKTPLLRGGRKPLGFLSLICKKSSSESAEDTRGNRGKVQKPRIGTPKRSLKKPTPSPKDDKEFCCPPSPSSSVECEHVAADTAVTVPSNNPSEKAPLCAEDQEKEEEPTRISEYFFSDIFMEVDDSE